MATAFEQLTTAIPPALSLANINDAPAQTPCEACQTSLLFLEDAFAEPSSYRYLEEPEREDAYPDFGGLKATAKKCPLCRLMRKTIRESWADVALEHSFGLVKESDGKFAYLKTAWTGEVRIILAAGFGQLAGAPDNETRLHRAPKAAVVDRIDVRVAPVLKETTLWRSKTHERCWKGFPLKIFPSTALKRRYPTLCRVLPSHETLSGENVDMMSTWLGACREHHNACQPSAQGPPWVPTRLLDVGTSGEQTLPRIVETRTGQGGVVQPYVALSHMWGDPHTSEPPTQTLRANYKDHLAGISSLSRNFRDAIQVCWRLGRRHIWIDSLCIVQDDSEDWKREAATMHLVYRMADVTIVATAATSPQDGFLARYLSRVPAAKIDFSLPEDAESSIPAHLILVPINHKVGAGVWDSDVEWSKWNTRGWTMQERSLSVRSLHFAKNQIYFECRAGIWPEENGYRRASRWSSWTFWPQPPPRLPRGIRSLGPRVLEALQITEQQVCEPWELLKSWPWPTEAPYSDGSGSRPEDEEDIAVRMARGHRKQWRDYWSEAVEQYSRRWLTRDSDKLVAIQSIANDVMAQTGDRYDAGSAFWTNTWAIDLTWCVEQGNPRRTSQSTIPSWSWAAIDGSIGWNKPSFGLKTHRDPPAFTRRGGAEPTTATLIWQAAGSTALAVHAWCRPISALRNVEHERPAGWRGCWALSGHGSPFSLVSGDGFGQVKVDVKPFARGDLDFHNRDNVLNLLLSAPGRSRFLYLHLLETHRHTGLILMESERTLHRSVPERIYHRIGVASIYGYGDGLMGEDDGPEWTWESVLLL